MQGDANPSDLLKKLIETRDISVAYTIYTQFRSNLFKLKLKRATIDSDEIGSIQVDEKGFIISGLPSTETTDISLI